MVDYAKKIALELKIKGLINIQFAIKETKVYVIEANPVLQEQHRSLQKHITNLT
jgi:carbamoylphosphate synthase large subunit